MSESQFEKMLKALKTAECEWDLSRHTIKIQDGIISELSEENKRLRAIVEEVENLHYGTDLFTACNDRIGIGRLIVLIEELEKEVSDE